MKKLISLVLALLMLTACGCGAVQDADEVIFRDTDMVDLAATAAKEVRISLSDKAYVRGGTYASMNWREINAQLGLDTNNEEVLQVKNDGVAAGNSYTRQIFLEFDLTELAAFEYNKVFLSPGWIKVDTSSVVCFNVYKLDPDAWDGETVTWNTKPALGEVLVSEVPVKGLGGVDVTEAVTDALQAGETRLSIAIYTGAQHAGECSMDPKLTQLVGTTADVMGTYTYQLVEDETANEAIWTWAQTLYDQWNARYLEIKDSAAIEADLIVSDADEYTKTVYSSSSGFATEWTVNNVNNARATRTYDALDDLGDYSDYGTEYEMDIYGGWMDPGLKQEATGFFYSKKVSGRWYVFDPLGYPCYIRGMSSVGLNYLDSPNQKDAALEKYGTDEKFAISTVRWIKDDLGFNLSGSSSLLNKVESRFIIQSSIGFAGTYGTKIGTNTSVGGSTVFSENNTMNVFDPGFVTHADERAQQAAADAENQWIVGYTTDNELPMDANMLYNYLQLDYTKAVNHYSYAAAWTWLINMTGVAAPTQDDITAEMEELFMGFVWDRYYNVVTTAFKTYDPNHMMLGTRFLTKVKDHPWVLRFASLYLDCMTINWYGQWEPDANDLYAIAQNADVPIMITEFYTKALENDGSFDDPNDPLKNTRGAGWVVRTQQDRGDFYQNFTLRLIESKNVIGWHWHQYLDDDDSPEVIYMADGVTWRDQSNIDANKGIVNNWHEPYEELCEAMAEINLNAYRLAEHFDAKYAAKAE